VCSDVVRGDLRSEFGNSQCGNSCRKPRDSTTGIDEDTTLLISDTV
jgi:hypothetical protein